MEGPARLLCSGPGRQEPSGWAGHIPRRMAAEEAGGRPVTPPAVERLSCAPSLAFPLHRRFHPSVLRLGQGAALWLLPGRIHGLLLLMAPPPPPGEQQAAHGQQD